MSAAAIVFDRVAKAYADVVAVRDLSFAAERGSLTTLLGPSGCGKTTVLRLIAGLELPTRGTITIGGRDVSHVPAAERDVAMVFQSYALFPHMSVLANVRYGLDVSGVPKPVATERAQATLATVGLARYGERLPSELSGGQQQRVALARALVLEPSVLLFDEPLSNLDARLRRQMRDEIRALQQRLALTVVYVTHDQAEAMAVSDHVIVMTRGAIAQEGTPREVYGRPRDAFVASFMGDANLVDGILARRDGVTTLMVGGATVVIPESALPDGPVTASIRPESIGVAASKDTDADGAVIEGASTRSESLLRGQVRRAAFVGPAIEYSLATDVGELFALSQDTDATLCPGTPVSISLAARGIALLPRRAPA